MEDLNKLAYALSYDLQNCTETFANIHGGIPIEVAMGAANIFLACWHIHAPNKAHALETLERNFAIIRNMVATTPDELFGGSVPPFPMFN